MTPDAQPWKLTIGIHDFVAIDILCTHMTFFYRICGKCMPRRSTVLETSLPMLDGILIYSLKCYSTKMMPTLCCFWHNTWGIGQKQLASIWGTMKGYPCLKRYTYVTTENQAIVIASILCKLGCDAHAQSCEDSVSEHSRDETWRSKLVVSIQASLCVYVFVHIHVLYVHICQPVHVRLHFRIGVGLLLGTVHISLDCCQPH